MIEQVTPLAQTNNFIVLERYEREWTAQEHYQSEADLENEFIEDLKRQGYEYCPQIKNQKDMIANVRVQLQNLNEVQFSESEWKRFVETYLDKPGDTRIDKTRKIHDDYIHDFVFDEGRIQNIALLDKNTFTRNKMQVIRQFEQAGQHKNRYDVTILINGLPLVQIELKRRGVALREAFSQIDRYERESFNAEHSLYKYLQLFVISNGTDSRYFSSTTNRDKNSFDFTINWALADNQPIKDLKDFTATFLQKRVLLHVLLRYSVFDIDNNLLIMRPYQIAATERILWKINSSFQAKNWCNQTSGGYVWHTTGSGKTLTSFKAARLATKLDFIDKVLFVVDRKDLDYQTMKEYQRFSPDSVNGSNNTAGLRRNLANGDNKIIVTTIQKLNHLMKTEKDTVFIFDECHRSQFGEAQRNLRKRFKKFLQFGFTGTPIFDENAAGSETTESVFGSKLHSYVITDAIRDEKVLKFKVDYHNVRPKFKEFESEQDEVKLSAAEQAHALLHPERIREIVRYILDNFSRKTHRQQGNKGFNAMLAVNNVKAAQSYYDTFKQLQQNSKKPLSIATIFSFAANEEPAAEGNPATIGNIADESFDIAAMPRSAKEFLSVAIDDYNQKFKTNFHIDSDGFQNYYRDLALRVKAGEVDLLIVVGMFLTGFDAPRLNTLFVDKNLRYHGLIQAYSRTNRILDATKTFGNIVTFRDLEQATIDAITLFGDENTRNIILERSYQDYMEGFTDALDGKERRGFKDVINQLAQQFPQPTVIEEEADKRAFVKLFGDYLRLENILQNYDEFEQLKKLQQIDPNNAQALEDFRQTHHLSHEELATLQTINLPSEWTIQDYKSTYNDIRDWLRRERTGAEEEKFAYSWDDVVFEVDLLKSQEINLDYILEQIFEKNKQVKDKGHLVEDVRRIIRASLGNRAKESLAVDFINQTNLDTIGNAPSLIEAFYRFAQDVQKSEAEALIEAENLNASAAKRYIMASIKRGYADDHGSDLNNILPKITPLNPQFLTKKESIFQKIVAFVEKFKGIGGEI